MTELLAKLLAQLFASGRIIDVILALVALEGAALLLWHRRTGRGPAAIPLLCNLASGAALMLAVRAALTGAAWPAVATCLLLSLVAHASELVLRLRDPRKRRARRDHTPQLRDGGTSADIVTFSGRRQH